MLLIELNWTEPNLVEGSRNEEKEEEKKVEYDMYGCCSNSFDDETTIQTKIFSFQCIQTNHYNRFFFFNLFHSHTNTR